MHGHGLRFSRSFLDRWTCLGYRLEADGKVLAISGDTVECDALDRLAKEADLLVQCCYLARSEITTPAFIRLAGATIACGDSVGRVATRAKAKSLVLTHFRPKPERVMAALADEVRCDYDGPVTLGVDLAEFAV